MRTQRIEQINDYILENKTVSIDTLCEVFQVSRNTIRRDLDSLVKRGTISKIYGGVIANNVKETVPFEERNTTNIDLKQRIAKKAAEFVQDGDAIFIDSGTTATSLFDQLPKNLNLTLFTNNLEILIRSIYENDYRVFATGGQLAKETYSTVGADAARIFKNYNIGKAFLSATAVSIEHGATNSTEGEYEVKKAALECSTITYLLIDSTKFDKFSLLTYAKLPDFNAVITDKMPSNRYVDYFKEHGVELIIAD